MKQIEFALSRVMIILIDNCIGRRIYEKSNHERYSQN